MSKLTFYRVRLTCWLGLILLLFAWSYWPTLLRTVWTWNSDADYSHGFLVLPIAYAIWVRRRDVVESTWGRASVWGLLLVALAGLLRIVAGRYYLLQVDGWSIPLWLGGVLWCLAGWPAFVRAWPALAFLWFGCPLPDRFQLMMSLPLQEQAAAGSAWILQCFQYPAVAAGTTLLLGADIFEVEHACSGLRMFFGSLAMATAFIFLGPRDRLTQVALLLAVAPVALLANIVRIVVTALTYQRASNELARRFVHDFAGLLMVAVVFLLFGLLVTVIRLGREWSRQNRDQFVRWLPVWPVTAISTLVMVWLWHSRQADLVQNSLLLTAGRFESANDWRSATEYLRRYVQLNPNDAPALARLAQALNLSATNLPEQRRALTALTAAWKANSQDLSILSQLAGLSVELRQYPQTIESAEAILNHPEASQAEHAELRQLAARWRAVAMYDLLAESEEYAPFGWSDVVVALNVATELDPAYPQHAFRLAMVYRDRLKVPSAAERSTAADAIIDRMVSGNEELAEAWLVRFRYRREYQRTDRSTPDELASIDADLNRALLLDEKAADRNVHILVAVAERMRERGELDTSLSYYQLALQANSLDVRPYLAISGIWIDKGTPRGRQQAVDVLKQGLSIIGANEVPLLFPLIEQLALLQQDEEADRYTTQAETSILEYPEPIRTTFRLQLQQVRSWRIANRSEYATAATELSQVLDALPPKYVRASASYVAQAWATVGQYHRMANDWDRSTDAYQRASALDEAFRMEYRWSMARRAELSGNLDVAAQQFHDIAASSQDSLTAWIDAAAVALRQQILLPAPLRDWTQFRRSIDSAKAVAGNRADDVLVLEMNYLLILGQDERVIKTLEEALQATPQSATLRRTLALLQVRRGQIDAALETAQQIPPADGDPTEAVLLRKEILCAAERFDDAIQLLQEVLVAEGPKDVTTLRLELAWIYLQLGRWQEAREWLDQAAQNAPDDLRVTEARGQLAWCLQDGSLLEECESQLRLIEGSYGPMWRAFRIRRILSQSAVSGGSGGASLSEVEDLTQQLESLYPHMQQTRIAAGRVATYRGLLWKAVANYEEAWDLGLPRVSLAVDLISLLNELGETDRAQRYVTEIRQYLSATQSVINSEVLDVVNESAEEAIRLSEALVRDHPDTESYLRLGRTLVLTALPRNRDYESRLERAEQAFRAAVKLDPSNTQAWAALFRYLVAVRSDPIESQTVLTQFASREDISQLNRTFVLAQLNESIENYTLADKLYRDALELARAEVATAERLIVLERAAQYFRRAQPELSEQCCREALKIDRSSLGPVQILLELLLAKRNEAAATESMEWLTVMDPTWQGSDQGKRLQARVLLEASRWSSQDPARLRQQAAELLGRLANKHSHDALLLAEIYLLDDQLGPAVAELRVVAESLPNNLDSLLQFLHTYDGKLFADTRSRLYAERIYDQLEELPELGLDALEQRLEMTLSRTGGNESQRQAAAAAIINRFARSLVEREVDESDPFQLLAQLMQRLIANGRWESAQQLTQLAPDLLPAPRPAAALATALAMSDPKLEQVQLLKSQLQRWLTDYPANPELQFAVANVHLMFGENEPAISLLRATLTRAPAHSMTLNNLALALAQHDTANLAESRQLVEQAMTLSGRTPELLDTLAVLLLMQGEVQPALDCLLEALPQANSAALLFLHLAWAWSEQGELPLARFAWSMAVSRGIDTQVLSPADQAVYANLNAQLFEAESP